MIEIFNLKNIMILLGAFICSTLVGRFVLPQLKRLNAGQSIRDDGPSSHLVKEGTPTMGGIIFLLTLCLGILVFRLFDIEGLLLIFSTLAFGLVGFFDDYIKVVKKRNLGFTALQKLLCQILIAFILVFVQSKNKGLSTEIIIPFVQSPWDMGAFYIPFIIFVVVGTVNSVNLTDGLDGLSSSITITVAIFFALAANALNHPTIESFALLLVGSLAGFLVYNKYPAKVFMGDTGSLALGGAVAAMAVLLQLPILLPLAGGIYFVETLSVILQVISFKLTGKRIFLMSPLHHHYEQKGWHEKKVVKVFVLSSILLCLLAYLLLLYGVVR